jgi:hypothetical protein
LTKQADLRELNRDAVLPDVSFEFLTKFFSEHLPFTPTAGQVADFKSDLALVSPFLMEASLIEVKSGTLGNILVYRPNEWRAAIFKVYYRKVAEHAQLFPVFHSFETAFRSTVALQLEQHYSHKRWWRAVYEAMRKGQAPKPRCVDNGTVFASRNFTDGTFGLKLYFFHPARATLPVHPWFLKRSQSGSKTFYFAHTSPLID